MSNAEFIEVGNWAMLVERGLDPNVAKRVAKQYTDKCAEVERLRMEGRQSENSNPTTGG